MVIARTSVSDMRNYSFVSHADGFAAYNKIKREWFSHMDLLNSARICR